MATEPNLKSAQSFNELTDPMMWKNKHVTIRAIAGFVLQGRAPVEEGEVLKVTKSFASELVASGKAEVVPDQEPPKRVEAVSDPNFIPQLGSNPPQPPPEPAKVDPKPPGKK